LAAAKIAATTPINGHDSVLVSIDEIVVTQQNTSRKQAPAVSTQASKQEPQPQLQSVQNLYPLKMCGNTLKMPQEPMRLFIPIAVGCQPFLRSYATLCATAKKSAGIRARNIQVFCLSAAAQMNNRDILVLIHLGIRMFRTSAIPGSST
jgi:hypothetical protein